MRKEKEGNGETIERGFVGVCDCNRANTYLQNVQVLLTEGNTEGEAVTGISAGKTGPSLRSGRADLVDVEGGRYGNEAEQGNDKQGARHASIVRQPGDARLATWDRKEFNDALNGHPGASST